MLINKFIKNSWTNMNIRAGKYRHLRTISKCNSYSNISIEFSREEYKQYCLEIKDIIEKLSRPSVDRINSNLNYTLNNIRIIELSDNIKLKKTSNYYLSDKCNIKRGVRLMKNGNFSVRICINKKEKHLGVFKTKEEAYDKFKNIYYEYYKKYPW